MKRVMKARTQPPATPDRITGLPFRVWETFMESKETPTMAVAMTIRITNSF
jgi:hypothetical protein